MFPAQPCLGLQRHDIPATQIYCKAAQRFKAEKTVGVGQHWYILTAASRTAMSGEVRRLWYAATMSSLSAFGMWPLKLCQPCTRQDVDHLPAWFVLGRWWCKQPGLHLLQQNVTQLHQSEGCCDEILTPLTFSIAQISDICVLIAWLTKGCTWPAPPPNIQSISEGRIKHTPLSTIDETLDHNAMSTQSTPFIVQAVHAAKL